MIVISNDEVKDIMKISLEESRVLNKVVNSTAENETKKLRGGFLAISSSSC